MRDERWEEKKKKKKQVVPSKRENCKLPKLGKKPAKHRTISTEVSTLDDDEILITDAGRGTHE